MVFPALKPCGGRSFSGRGRAIAWEHFKSPIFALDGRRYYRVLSRRDPARREMNSVLEGRGIRPEASARK